MGAKRKPNKINRVSKKLRPLPPKKTLDEKLTARKSDAEFQSIGNFQKANW